MQHLLIGSGLVVFSDCRELHGDGDDGNTAVFNGDELGIGTIRN